MSLYDAAKDALKIAQKMDNIELTQKLMDVQNQALEMQDEIFKLKKTITDLKEVKKFVLAPGKKYLIDPAFPARPLCPVCTMKNGFETPINDYAYCAHCKVSYNS